MTAKTGILLGVCGALAAGVVIGLLVAPEKGAETRKKLRKTAGDWVDGLGRMWQNGKQTAEDLKDGVRTAASAYTNE